MTETRTDRGNWRISPVRPDRGQGTAQWHFDAEQDTLAQLESANAAMRALLAELRDLRAKQDAIAERLDELRGAGLASGFGSSTRAGRAGRTARCSARRPVSQATLERSK